jgi:hypothetical protein
MIVILMRLVHFLGQIRICCVGSSLHVPRFLARLLAWPLLSILGFRPRIPLISPNLSHARYLEGQEWVFAWSGYASSLCRGLIQPDLAPGRELFQSYCNAVGLAWILW